MSIAEIIEPTPERLRHARNGVDAPQIDQKTARRAPRVVSLVDAMYRQGRLSKHCWDSYRRFEQDHLASQFYPSRICRYGVQAMGQTPVNQLTPEAMDAAEMGMERRLHAEQKAAAAKSAIGGDPLKALLMAIDENTDLETIGRKLSVYSGKMQCQAAASTLIQVALDRLHQHYEGG